MAVWNSEEVLNFIDLYQNEPIIWNPKHEQHKNKNKVNDAWNRIADNLHAPVNELKKKKESRMATFRLHHKKKMQSKKSGMGEDELYNPIWPFYEPLYNFLKDVYECRSLMNTEENNLQASQTTDNEDQTSVNTNCKSPVSETSSRSEIVPETSSSSEIYKRTVPVVKRRAKEPPELAEASKEMSKAFSTLNKVLNAKTATQDDECELYGRLLAKKLIKFSEYEREEIMCDIDNMIMNRRRNKQSTQNNSYSYLNTIRPGSSQSSDQSEWSYTSPPPHTRPPSADVNRSTYTPYEAPRQGLKILSNEIIPIQIIQSFSQVSFQIFYTRHIKMHNSILCNKVGKLSIAH